MSVMSSGEDKLDKKVLRISTVAYLAISLSVSLGFLVFSSLSGDYPPVARYGGAVWTFFLTLIVSMPWATSYFRRRYGQN